MRGPWTIRIRNLAREIVPRHLVIAARLCNIYLRDRGIARRDALGMCVNADNQPVPWITLPATDFLDNLDLTGCRVFEFGGGASTAYFSRRGCQVAGVEMDVDWHARVESLRLPNVSLRLCADGGRYPASIDELPGDFHLILIDGAERFRSAQQALAHLAPGGLLILDNSDWYPQTASMLRQEGLTQIDFCGFAPLNSFPHMTSMFFRHRIDLKYLSRPNDWHPTGGRTIPGGALDDGPPASGGSLAAA